MRRRIRNKNLTLTDRLIGGIIASLASAAAIIVFLMAFFYIGMRAREPEVYETNLLSNFDLWAITTCLGTFVLGFLFGPGQLVAIAGRVFGTDKSGDPYMAGLFVFLSLLIAFLSWHAYN